MTRRSSMILIGIAVAGLSLGGAQAALTSAPASEFTARRPWRKRVHVRAGRSLKKGQSCCISFRAFTRAARRGHNFSEATDRSNPSERP